MTSKNTLVDFKEIKACFNKYVLPTMLSNFKSDIYIKKRVERICERLNLKYISESDKLSMTIDDYKKLEVFFYNRYLYCQKKLQLYSIIEASEILGISQGHFYKLIQEKVVKLATTIEGLSYFYKSEIDNIHSILITTYSYKEITSSVKEKSQYPEIGSINIRNYIKRHFNFIINPVDKYDIRLKKSDLQLLIKFINLNFKPRNKPKNYMPIFKELNIKSFKYIEDDSDSCNKYVGYKVLRQLYLDNYLKKDKGSSTGPEKVIRHVVSVCCSLEIDWFTNIEMNNIFILKEDKPKFLDYYNNVSQIISSGIYYSSSEIRKIFNITNIESIQRHTGFTTIGNTVYIEKKKINDLLEIYRNTISADELSSQLKVSIRSLYNCLDNLGIEYFKAKQIPYKDVGLIYKKDVSMIKKHMTLEEELSRATSVYEKYLIMIRDTKFTYQITKSLKAYNDYVLIRFKRNKALLCSLAYIYKHILTKLTREIMQYTDEAISALINEIDYETIAKREFIFFINYCNNHFYTNYNKYHIDLIENQKSSEPYTLKQWKSFGYLLFDTNNPFYEQYIKKSINSRTYAMVWLYCAMHYVCGARSKDIRNKLPLPSLDYTLNMNEYELLECLNSGMFNEIMAQTIVNDILKKIKGYGITPSKTKKTNKQLFKIVVQKRYVYTIGMLLALCEAHRKIAINNKNKNGKKCNIKVLITDIATRKEPHIEFFGAPYKEIFVEEHFQNIRATKTNLSFVQIVSQEKGWGVGYHIASMLRGHTFNKDGIAKTTEVYLQYINKNNDIDKITYGMSERGIFGFIPYLALKIEKGEEIKSLDILKQNEIIKELLPLKPLEIENLLRNGRIQFNKAKEVVLSLVTSENIDIKNVLKKISIGEVPSKMEHSQCLLKAIEKTRCIYPTRTDCIGCVYLISEIYLLLEFNNRLNLLIDKINKTKVDFDKKRLTDSLFNVYMPILNEAAIFLGKDRVNAFINLQDLKERINHLKSNNKLLLR